MNFNDVVGVGYDKIGIGFGCVVFVVIEIEYWCVFIDVVGNCSNVVD